jgi:NADH-quinone oxidoreductase subunit L
VVGIVGSLAQETATAAAAANWFAVHAWLIPLLPFASGVLTLFLGKRTPGKGPVYGIVAVGAAFVLALGVLLNFAHGGGVYQQNVDWFTVGPLNLQLGIYIDGLAGAMLVVVTAISLAVHVYSLGYMHGDVRYTWFYFVLSMFTGAMLVVVVSSNVIQLLVGWEIMGVCSYLLIGHWFEEHANSSAAIKAFITTRIGDVPMMFGFFMLIWATSHGGTLTTNIPAIAEAVKSPTVSALYVSIAAILVFGGAVGKSAQFPLHVWLPDAMAGPTPVSALIHAATMVAAGVYLVGRMFEVFVQAQPWVLTTVSIVAAITMLGAAILAVAQDDIKRVLAYSTLSQLAYMVAGLSLGPEGLTAGFFHLFTHAFFKGLLFLCAGSLIHAVHSNNMSDMGGMRKYQPITFWTMLIGSLALAGVIPLAGFWSKDALLVVSWDTGHAWLFWTMLVTAALTALYTARMVVLTFFGEYRGHGHPHESPAVMTGPLVALAGATVFVGLLGAPQLHAVFGKWVYFGEPHAETFVAWIGLLSTIGAFGGIWLGWALYKERKAVDPLERALGQGVWNTLLNRYYIDAFYMRAIIYPVRDGLSAAVYWFNQRILDGIVNGAAALARGLSKVVSWFDRSVIDGAVNGAAAAAEEGGGFLKYLQSGNVQWYAVGLFAGVLVLTAIFIKT